MSIENGMELYIFDGKGGKVRYVRADVAIRHARAEARKAYNLALNEVFIDEDEIGHFLNSASFENAVLKQKAQQALQQYHFEKCHTCNRMKTACVCGMREGK